MIELIIVIAAFLLGVVVGWFLAMRRIDLELDKLGEENK